MTIGIDIRVLGSKTRSGIEEYTENLLSHLLPLDKGIRFKLFFSSKKHELSDYDWLRLPNVELHKFNISNKLLLASSRFLGGSQVDKMIEGADVFFSPHFLLTSLSANCRRVITFHDLSYVHFPEFFSWRRNLWHGIEMRPVWQSKFTDKIIAVSESTKNDLVDNYNVDPSKIRVIYSGISPEIKRPDEEELEAFRTKNRLPKRFILFLGKLEPRKNITGIVKAFHIIKQQNNSEDLKLVIAGSRGWLDGGIFEEVRHTNHKNDIRFEEYVSDSERKFYYSLASVFVYPSFFEGFGFPPLEAMACGTPVVTSFNSSLPEVVGNGAILVDPHNLDNLVSSIRSILESPISKSHLSYKGSGQITKFSWSKTASETLEYLIK